MKVLNIRNVHQALPDGLDILSREGIRNQSRAGEVLELPYPLVTAYKNPKERVVFWEERDANPFFHLMEGLYILAERNDVKWISQFNSHIKTFSDDGIIFRGAYGHRWRVHFYDQVIYIIVELKSNPFTRRLVLQTWDCKLDLAQDSKDIPCNTQIYFRNNDGKLDITVMARSNDAIWGAYGANAVHMSMLQEYIASMSGLETGAYYQFSNNFHVYTDIFDKHKDLLIHASDPYRTMSRCPYQSGIVEPFPMVSDPKTWNIDLDLFFEDPASNGFTNEFFSQVAKPIYWSYMAFKNKKDSARFDTSLEIIHQCKASDWQLACKEWLERRRDNA